MTTITTRAPTRTRRPRAIRFGAVAAIAAMITVGVLTFVGEADTDPVPSDPGPTSPSVDLGTHTSGHLARLQEASTADQSVPEMSPGEELERIRAGAQRAPRSSEYSLPLQGPR